MWLWHHCDVTMSSYTRGAPTVFFISAVCVLAMRDWDAGDGGSGGHISFVGGRYSGHPMLYFGREAVPELRRAGLGTHAQLALQIRQAGEAMLSNPGQFLPPSDPQEFSARWNEIYGNNLCVLALFCLLYPQDSGAVSLARQYMERMASQPSWYCVCVRERKFVCVTAFWKCVSVETWSLVVFSGGQGLCSTLNYEPHWSHFPKLFWLFNSLFISVLIIFIKALK